MAYPGKVIVSPRRGEQVEFLQTEGETNGRLLQLSYRFAPGAGYLNPHLHLLFEEQFEIVSGVATYSINGAEYTAYPREVFSVPAGTKHVNPWNKDGSEELHVHQVVSPPHGTEIFLETLYACVRDQRHVTKDNQLNMFQSAITDQFAGTKTYSADLPLLIQRVTMPVAAFVARLLGYKAYYPGA